MSIRWDISGRLTVDESVTAADTNGTVVTRRRPLAGVMVEVTGSPIDGARQTIWARAMTDDDGEFRVRTHAQATPHAFRVAARFAGERLVVTDARTDGVLRRDWMELPATGEPLEGPRIDLGTFAYGALGWGALGDPDNLRRAVTWYVAHSAMRYLESLGSGLGFTNRIAIVYPSVSPHGISTVDARGRVAFVHCDATRDEWSVETVLALLMQLWALREADGGTRWPRLARGIAQLGTSAPASLTALGFAELARDELLAALWGRRLGRVQTPRRLLDPLSTTASHPVPRALRERAAG